MEKRGTGICQGLFNFILNTLSPRTFKRDTMANNPHHPPDIPIEGSSRNGLNPEVVVEYGHDVGWFNDPSRYNNIWGGSRNTTPPSIINVSSKEIKNKTTSPPSPPRRPTLLSVASNINEKAEAFIHRRKEKMGRSYSLDLKKF